MKIAVLGAGAMGSLYGGYLAKYTDEDIWLIDVNEEHVDKINSEGLIIENSETCMRVNNVKATTRPADIGCVDLLIVFVKSTITMEAMLSVKDIIGEKTTILTLQNGVGNIEKIKEVVGDNRIIAGTTSNGSTMKSPGVIYHAGKGKTTIGEIDSDNSNIVYTIEELFNKATLSTSITDNPIGLIWDKLMVNVGINALTAVTGLKNGMLVEYSETEEILEQAVKEACKVANKLSIKLNNHDPVRHTKDVCRLTSNNTSSMLQDIIGKRRTEIDMINGAIVRYGKEYGIDTPINFMLTNLIIIKEK